MKRTYLYILSAFILVSTSSIVTAQEDADAMAIENAASLHDANGFGGGVDGNLMVASTNGNVSYSYPISSRTINGHPVTVSLNHCGSVGFTTFNNYFPNNPVQIGKIDGWNSFHVNRPAWLIGVNGFAIQALSTTTQFSNYLASFVGPYRLFYDPDFVWLIDGYDYCNRVSKIQTGEESDVIRILRSDGSLLILKNPVRPQDRSNDINSPDLFTGKYYNASAGSRSFAVVTFDSTNLWPEYIKNALYDIAGAQRNAFIPRVVRYYDGDGLEYVFREHPAPYGTTMLRHNVIRYGAPTIFYLENINDDTRTLLTFSRSRHALSGADKDSTRGRALTTSFEGHTISYNNDYLTLEALGRTTKVKFGAYSNGSGWSTSLLYGLDKNMPLQKIGYLYPWAKDFSRSTNSAEYSSYLGYVNEIIDPENRKTEFYYEKYRRKYKKLGFPVPTQTNSDNTISFDNYRLKKLVNPASVTKLTYYGALDSTYEKTGTTLNFAPISYFLNNVVKTVQKHTPDTTLLTTRQYIFTNPTPSSGDIDDVGTLLQDMPWDAIQIFTDHALNKETISKEHYVRYRIALPNSTENARDSVAQTILKRIETRSGTDSSITSILYKKIAPYLIVPVSRKTEIREDGTPVFITASRSQTDYELSPMLTTNSIALSGYYGKDIARTRTKVMRPDNPSDTLYRYITEYLDLPLLQTTVSRIDSMWQEGRSKYVTDSLRLRGAETTVNLYTSTTITNAPWNVPPLYGLVSKQLTLDATDTIGGQVNVYHTSYDANPLFRRGVLKHDSIIGDGGSYRLLGNLYSYTGGWYRNLPAGIENSFGSRSRVFYDGINIGSTGYPVGKLLKNNNVSINKTLFDVQSLFEAPLASHTEVRKYDPLLQLGKREFYNFTERTFYGLPKSSVDENGIYSASRYDNNGRIKNIWLPFDFPASETYTGTENVILPGYSMEFQTKITEHCNQYIASEIDNTNPESTTYSNLPASYYVDKDPRCPTCPPMAKKGDEPPQVLGIATSCYVDRSERYRRRTVFMEYIAGATDKVHTVTNATKATLDLAVASYTSRKVVQVLIEFPRFKYSRTLVLGFPKKKGENSALSSTYPVVKIDILPILDSLRAMTAGEKALIAINVQTVDAAVNFANDAEDVNPRLTITGSFPFDEVRDYTAAFTYDDKNRIHTTRMKVDDAGHSNNNISPSAPIRYTLSDEVLGTDFRVLKSRSYIVEANNRIDSVVYSSSGAGFTTGITDQEGNITSLEYDRVGRPYKVINADNTTAKSTSSFGLPSRYPLSGQDFLGFASAITSTSENGVRQTSYSDALGRLRRTVSDSGQNNAILLLEYTSRGQVKYSISPKGDTTKYWYDAFGRVKYKHQPDIGYISFRYDDLGNLRFSQTEEQSSTGFVSFIEYDDLNRPIVSGEASVTLPEQIQRPAGGDTISVTRLTDFLNPNILHDEGISPFVTLNKTLWMTPSDTVPLPWGYSQPTITGCMPPNWGIVNMLLGSDVQPVPPYMKHRVRNYEPLQYPITALHSNFENLASFPQHVLSASSYDTLPVTAGAVWANFPPHSTWNSFAPKGEVRYTKGKAAAIAYRDHAGEPYHYTVMSYDERGRLEALLRYTENIGFDAVYYAYNSMDQVITVRVADELRVHNTWYRYDREGRVRAVTAHLQLVGSGLGAGTPAYPIAFPPPNAEDISYEFDKRSNISAVYYGNFGSTVDAFVELAYTSRNQLQSITAKKLSNMDLIFTETLGYNSLGLDRVESQTSQHAGQTQRVQTYQFDGLQRLNSWTNTINGTTTGESWLYDPAGNPLSQLRNEGSIYTTNNFYADPVGRNRQTGADLFVNGTPTGKIYNLYSTVGSLTDRTERDNNNIVTKHETFGYSSSSGLLRRYTNQYFGFQYECLPYPVTMDAQKWDWRYRYSVGGEREQKRLYYSPTGDSCNKVHAWAYYLLGAGDEQLAVYHGAQIAGDTYCGDATRNVWMYPAEYISHGARGAEIITRADGSKEYRLGDHLGSPRAIVNSGGIMQQYDYRPFGGLLIGAASGSRMNYIEKEQDNESGFSNFGVRGYDTRSGRFTSIDPLFELYPGESPYHYCGNDPVNFLDPSGLKGETPMKKGVGPDGKPMYIVEEGVTVVAARIFMSPVNDGSGGNYGSNQVGSAGSRGRASGVSNKTTDPSVALDFLQGALDVAGLVPGAGEVADGINAAIYAYRGDYTNAALSGAAMIPFAGWGATGAKIINKVTKYSKLADGVGSTKKILEFHATSRINTKIMFNDMTQGASKQLIKTPSGNIIKANFQDGTAIQFRNFSTKSGEKTHSTIEFINSGGLFNKWKFNK